MSKFTKGTWRASFEENKYIWSSDDQVLGELYFTTPEETEANARLIADAPEMYKMMKNTSNYILECAKLYSPFPDELCMYAERNKELLARIDGEEERDNNDAR